MLLRRQMRPVTHLYQYMRRASLCLHFDYGGFFMTIISPSLLACDFSRMGEELKKIEEAGAEWVHLDVMDGAFVPNISFGLPVIESLRRVSSLVFDVHLMIEEPIRYISRFAEAGADYITVHAEACTDIGETLAAIHACGKRSGLSVKPNTPVEVLYPYLDDCDMILIMSVEPGYGGQALIPHTMDKMKMLKEELVRRGKNILIEVDGGINLKTAPMARESGADVLVAGSAVFGKDDVRAAVAALR